jgi:hypothetical protein
MSYPQPHAARLPADLRATGYGISIVVNVILLYVVHHLLAWDVPILTPAFNDVLWAVDLSLGATIVANAIFMAYDPRWFRHVSDIVLDLLALLSVYMIYRVFPFQFEQAWWYDVTPLVLLVVMIAILIAIVVNLVQAVTDGLKEVSR